MNIVQGRSTRLTHSFIDGDDTLPIGERVVTARAVDNHSSTDLTVTVTGDVASAVLPPQYELGDITMEWVLFLEDGTSFVDRFDMDVVGSDVVTVKEMRSIDKVLENTTKYPAADLIEARDRALDEFESILGFPLMSKAAMVRVQRIGTGSTGIGLVDTPYVTSVITAFVNGQELSPTDAARILPMEYGGFDINGLGSSGWLTGINARPNDILVKYAYGMTSVPADLKGVLLQRIRYFLLNESSSINDRTTTFSSADGGTYSLSVAGRGGAETGIPDVDAVLKRYRWTKVGMA